MVPCSGYLLKVMLDTATAPNPPKKALLIVFLVVFIDLLGFGIVLPILPRIAEGFMVYASDSLRGLVIGGLLSAFSLMQFLVSPMWGRVSDRIGRRPILLLSLAGSIVFYALFGYACTMNENPTLGLVLMLVARIGAGIAGASVGTAAAVIADCTTPDTRGKGMALIGIAFGGGFTLGPLIAFFGMKLFQDEPWAVGGIASALSVVAFILAIVLLPETRRPSTGNERGFFSLSRTLAVLKEPLIGPLVLIYFLAIFAFANFEVALSLFTKSAFAMTDEDNFLVFAYVGCVLLVAGGMYRPIVKKRPEALLLSLGVGLLLLGMGGLGTVAFGASMLYGTTSLSLKPLFYLAMTVAVIGFAFVNPSVNALISKRADPARQGEVIGVNQGCSALARILGPMVGSYAFFAHSSRVLPFAIASLTLVVVIMLLPLLKPKPAS